MEARAGERTGSPPARLLIVDDHDLIRDSFRRALDREEDLEVVGEAKDGREAVELCRLLGPDLVLMDVRMPEMDGLEATREIKARQPEVIVLVVTTYENPDYLLEAMKAGAAGFVLKGARKHQIVEAVRRVLIGESPVNEDLAARLIQRFIQETRRTPRSPAARREENPTEGTSALREELTPRELEVLKLLGQGKTNPQISEVLEISRGTVKIHVEHIIAKLGVSDRTQAVVRAIEVGLIEP